jgi:hypothetical protein
MVVKLSALTGKYSLVKTFQTGTGDSPSLFNGDRVFYPGRVNWPVYKVNKQRSSSSVSAFEMNLITSPLSIRFNASTLNYGIVTVKGI